MKSLVLPGVKSDIGSRRRFLITSEKVGKKRSVERVLFRYQISVYF